MQDILEIISDMRELRQLYKTGELVEHDIQRLLNKWEKTFDEQEKIIARSDYLFAHEGKV